jgi:hypothetical protein
MVAPAPAALSLQAPALRSLVQDCIAKHLYPTAVFFADKLVSITCYSAGDVFLLAQVRRQNAAERGPFEMLHTAL